MEKPLKKRRRKVRTSQLLSLILLITALAAGLIFWVLASRTAHEIPKVEAETTSRTLLRHDTASVTRIAVNRQGQEVYVLLGDNGSLAVSGQPDFVMDSDMAKRMLEACAILTVEDTVAETSGEWEADKAEFGLELPAVTVDVNYADGSAASFSLGDKVPNANLYYYTLAGDPGLYLASADMPELFQMNLGALHQVDQPVIHSSRIDRITITGGSGALEAEWVLETGTASGDASWSWRMTAPYDYPCDVSAMNTLLSALENLYLGQFAAPATEEEKARCGLDTPLRTITVHQAAGDVASVNASGVYKTTSYPESTFQMAVGAAQGEYVRFCQVGEKIYLVSSLSQPFLSTLTPETTLLTQPAAIPLEAVASLVVEKAGERREYTLRRQERLLPNNELETDEAGNVLTDTFVAVNGQDTDFEAFSQSIALLQAVTVSGRLPEGFVPSGEPSLRLAFTLLDGRTRTLECLPFDALQDALRLDGACVQYLPKGELDKGL